MKIGLPKETQPGETRAPMIPANVAKLVKLGAQVEIEADLGRASGFADSDYLAVGATVTSDRKALLATSDLVLRLRKPPIDEVDYLKSGSIHVSFLDPFNEKELLRKLAARGISALCME